MLKSVRLAETWSMRPEESNPCTKIERNSGNERERFLTAEELGRLGSTLREAEAIGLAGRPSGSYRSRDHDRAAAVADRPIILVLLASNVARE